MTDAESNAKDALIFSALVNIGADVIEENKELKDKIKHLEARVGKLRLVLKSFMNVNFSAIMACYPMEMVDRARAALQEDEGMG